MLLTEEIFEVVECTISYAVSIRGAATGSF
jgi:hypothetical protein